MLLFLSVIFTGNGNGSCQSHPSSEWDLVAFITFILELHILIETFIQIVVESIYVVI